MRAAGHGLRVLMICFMKAKVAERNGSTVVNYGEFASIDTIPNFTIIPVGRLDFVDKENPDPIDIKLAQDGFKLAQQALESMSCDVLILDEINVAVEWNLISVKDLLAMIEKKPSGVELILTGRYAHPDVLQVADLVTEMIERKHYYSTKQLTARKGFEF